MQSQDAAIIVRVACQMLAKHHSEAIRCAELRATELRAAEPRAAARWHLVANTIGMLYEDICNPSV